MNTLSLADRLRLIWFEAGLRRFPPWMLAELIDAAELADPPKSLRAVAPAGEARHDGRTALRSIREGR